MSQRHNELKLERIVAIKACLAFIGIFNLTTTRVEDLIKHLESKGFKIVKLS